MAFVGGIDFTENRDDTWRHRRPNGRLVQLPWDQRHPTGNVTWSATGSGWAMGLAILWVRD